MDLQKCKYSHDRQCSKTTLPEYGFILCVIKYRRTYKISILKTQGSKIRENMEIQKSIHKSQRAWGSNTINTSNKLITKIWYP